MGKQTLWQIIQGLAEGWNLHSIARVFKVKPDTVKSCLVRAAEHMEVVSSYLIHDLHLSQVEQVQSTTLAPSAPAAQTVSCMRWVKSGDTSP